MRTDLRLSLKQRIGISTGFLIVIAIVGGSVGFWTGERVTGRVEEEQVISDIESVLYARSLIIAEYISTHDVSFAQEKQDEWEELSVRVDELTTEARRLLPEDHAQNTLQAFVEQNVKTEAAFTALIEAHVEGEEGSFGHVGSLDEHMLLQDLLTSERETYRLVDGFRKDVSTRLVDTASLAQWSIVGIAVFAIFSVIGIGIYFYRTSITPLGRLTRFARRLGEGELGATIDLDRGDELGLLAEAFNTSSTELAELTHTLRHRQARDEAILENIGEGLVVTGNEREIILLNREAEEKLGWTTEEASGQPIEKVIPMQYEDGTRVTPTEQPIRRAFEEGVEISSEMQNSEDIYYIIRKDQTSFPASVTATPLIRHGEVAGAIQIFRDISEARTVERMKSDFISIASHQLRTPLTGIQWVIDRIFKTEENLSEKTRDYLDDIRFSSKRLTELVTVLLNASRIEEGSVGITPEELDVPAEIDAFLKEVEPMRASKGVEITFDNKAGELIAMTDQYAFRNILQSLVMNALEYTPKGGHIAVILEVKKKVFKITVKDDGIGIPKDEQDKIFEKFSRAENAQRTKPNGTGLGLYIAREAARLLGGSINFTSVEGRGTKFYVSLPIEAKERRGDKRFA